MAFSIDPNVKGYINAAIAVCGVIATIGVSAFPSYVPAGAATDIVQTAGFIFMVYGALNSAGNFLSSSKPGILAPQDQAPVVAAQRVVDLTEAKAPPATIQAAKGIAVTTINTH